MSHPMLPGASHDEMAEQLFVRDLKGFVAGAAEEGQRAAAAALDPGEGHNARAEEIFDRLHGLASFRNWAALRRESQELLWDVVGASVRRQAAELEARAAPAPALGSVTVDPDFVIPSPLPHPDLPSLPGRLLGHAGAVARGHR